MTEGIECGSQRSWVLRLHQQALDVALHDALEAMDVRGDDRDAGSHRLEQHDAERFLAGVRRAEDVGAGEVADLVLVGDTAEPLDVADAAQADEAAVLAPLRPVADDEQARIDAALAQSVIRLEQVAEALSVLEAADEQDVQHAIAQILERLGVLEALEVDAVRDDPVVAGEVSVDEVPGRA